MKSAPRLSIGVPVYNGEFFLQGLFETLAAQTFTDFEIVISDNASTDRTAEICREWMTRDSRIRYHRNDSNIGSARNFNRVFDLSIAPLFKWAAVDDTYDSDYLAACIQIMDMNRDVVLAQTEVLCVDAHGKPFSKDPVSNAYVIPGTMLGFDIDSIELGESTSAARRFYDVLFRCRSNSQIFGVIRREALASTGRLPNFLGSEKSTLLELSLLGRFKHDRRAMFRRCYHPCVTAAKNSADAKTYISASEIEYSRPMRMLRAFLSTPVGKPISAMTHLACYAMLGARGVHFVANGLIQNSARSWPFRAVWRNGRNNRRSTPTL